MGWQRRPKGVCHCWLGLGGGRVGGRGDSVEEGSEQRTRAGGSRWPFFGSLPAQRFRHEMRWATPPCPGNTNSSSVAPRSPETNLSQTSLRSQRGGRTFFLRTSSRLGTASTSVLSFHRESEGGETNIVWEQEGRGKSCHSELRRPLSLFQVPKARVVPPPAGQAYRLSCTAKRAASAFVTQS